MKTIYPEHCDTLFTGQQIATKVSEMGREIEAHYAGREVTVVAVLHGALVFVADLMRQMDMPMHLTAIVASSYHGAATTPGQLNVRLDNKLDIAGRHVLVVDDILDTGRTLHRIRDVISELDPASVKVCALVDKPSRRVADIEADFCGFEIPDLFIVGYGLDYNGRFRNLPDIVGLDPDNLPVLD